MAQITSDDLAPFAGDELEEMKQTVLGWAERRGTPGFSGTSAEKKVRGSGELAGFLDFVGEIEAELAKRQA